MRTILVVAALVGLAFPATALARVPPRFVGVSADGPLLGPSVDLNRELDVMVASGVQTVRVTWSWPAAQPYETFRDVPAGSAARFANVAGVPTDFSSFDRLVAATALRRLALLPVVLYAPSWDSRNIFNLGAPPRNPVPFARFVAALAQRYGPGGDFWREHPSIPPLPIRDWQIWNEPNITFYWPTPFARGYTALLRATWSRLKAVEPRSRLILAGLTNDAWNALLKLYAAGARRYFDAVAIDPYTRHVSNLVKFLRLTRWAMAQGHDSHKPLLVTEYSWPSALHKIPPLRFNEVSTAQQADRVRRALLLLAGMRRRYHVTAAYWYTWLSSDRGSYYFDYAGLRTLRRAHGVVAKPAFAAFRRTALRLEGCRAKLSADRCAR